MGVVYKAEDTRLRRSVALKFLPDGRADNAEGHSRLLREARLAGRLNHPNICTIHEVGAADDDVQIEADAEGLIRKGTPYIAMEFVHGETLADLLAREGRLTIARSIEIAAQVAEGLAEAHSAGVIHRDLKPSNVMLRADGRVKILDFGLATAMAVDAEADASTRTVLHTDTRTGAPVLGTISYMSPERIQGHSADQRSDLFSFGTMLYEMVAGRRPFDGETHGDTLARIIGMMPPDLATVDPDVPDHVNRAVRRCLEKNPANRYDSARALRRDLVQPAAPHIGPRESAWHRSLPSAAVWSLVVVAAALAWTWWTAAPQEPTRQSRPAEDVLPARQLTFTGVATRPSISGDGQFVAFWNRDRLFVQDVSGGDAVPVYQDGPVMESRWSPNGSQLLLWRPDGAYIVPRLGGDVQRVAGNLSIGSFPVWFRDESTIAAIGTAGGNRAIVSHGVHEHGGGTRLCDLTDIGTWSGLEWSPARNAFLVLATGANRRRSVVSYQLNDCRKQVIAEADVSIGPARWAPDGNAVCRLESAPRRAGGTRAGARTDFPAAASAAGAGIALVHLAHVRVLASKPGDGIPTQAPLACAVCYLPAGAATGAITSRPLFSTIGLAFAERRNSISAFAASRWVARAASPAEKTVTRCVPGGRGPTKSTPGTGSSSLIC
jgi:hypothetical protein